MISLKRMSIRPKDLFLLEPILTEAGIKSEWKPQLKYSGGWYRDKDDPYLEVYEQEGDERTSAHYNRRYAYLNYSSTQAPNFDELMYITKTEYPYPKWFETMIQVGLISLAAALAYLFDSHTQLI